MKWAQGGAAMMFLAVALGAFGAHALKRILPAERLAVFDTGVRYQMVHGLALFVVAWLASARSSSAAVPWAGGLFFAGIILFSGSLYALSLTGVRVWGAITPLGGLFFLAGWACVFTAAFQN